MSKKPAENKDEKEGKAEVPPVASEAKGSSAKKSESLICITFLCNSKDCLWSCFNDGSDSSKCFSLRIG